jgi:hypothetical protein
MVNINAELGAEIGRDLGLLEILAMEAGTTVESLTSAKTAEYSTRGKARYLAIRMLMSSDRNRFGGLIEDLRNDYLTKNNRYPQTMGECFTLLNHWSRNPRNVPGAITPNNVGMAFVHDDDEDGEALVNNGDAVCTRCGRKNHTVEQCRARYHHDGTVLFMEEYDDDADHDQYSDNDAASGDDFAGLVFYMTGIEDDMIKQNRWKDIPKTWLLLDSQSTIDLACNPKLLTDIHQVERCLTIRCNAGKRTTNLRGTMPGYGDMWLYPHGIANILSLSQVKEKFRVTFNSAADNALHVHKPEKTIIFKEASRRLYYFDTDDQQEYAEVLVTTVAGNESKYSTYDYSQATLARSIQKRIG